MTRSRPRRSPLPSASITADVVIEDAGWGETGQWQSLVDQAIAATVATARLNVPPGAEVAVLFTTDGHIRELNRDYRGKDKPTNVLSFPAGPIPPRLPLLGDIVLARETVEAEALAEGKRREQHVTHLVVHGVLHLFGHDHEQDDEATEMERLETAVLAQLGWPDPHADGE